MLSWRVAPHRCGFLACQHDKQATEEILFPEYHTLLCKSRNSCFASTQHVFRPLKTKTEQHGLHGRTFLFIYPDIRNIIALFESYKAAFPCSIVRSFKVMISMEHWWIDTACSSYGTQNAILFRYSVRTAR